MNSINSLLLFNYMEETRHVIMYLCVDVLQIANTLMDNANKEKRNSCFSFIYRGNASKNVNEDIGSYE